jgi:anti-anti-sigma regulatory factor
MVPVHEAESIDTAPASDARLGGAETQLAVHIAHDGDTVVVRLSGALSGPRVPLFESVVYRLEKRGRARFTVDLRRLAVLDAAGAALVRRFEERVLKAGGSITLRTDGRPPEAADRRS